MEVKRKKVKGKPKNKNKSLLKMDNNVKKILICVVVIIVLLLIVIPKFKGQKVEIKVKSSLERIVEKGDLETVKFTYNVIAKQCKDKDKNNCDKSSNNIKDFEYVVSCKGSITAGIDFEKVKINEKNKNVIIEIPDAEVKSINIIQTNFLNGDKIPADELPNARKLCKDTIQEKSKEDKEILPAAKEQARVVLYEFYEGWIKAFDEEYTIDVK